MVALPMYCSPVVIGSTNKGVRISSGGGSTVNLVEGTYYISTLAGASSAAPCLLKALEVALGDANWTVGLDANGYVQLKHNSSTWEINCAHADTTIPLTAFGFNATTYGATGNT